MRILFLSNYYPPYSRGGYEQWCQEVAVELAQRGHQVQVLTSFVYTHPSVKKLDGVTVHRQLHLEVFGGLATTVKKLLFTRTKVENKNLQYVRQLIKEFTPDVVMNWGMWNMPRSVPALVEELMPGRVIYYLCDYWLSLPNAYLQRWQETSRQPAMRFIKSILGKIFLPALQAEEPVALKLEKPICVSAAVRKLLVEKGVSISHADVIYGGTQVDEFLAAAKSHAKEAQQIRLVYIGRIVQDKGVHVIVEAVRRLVNENDLALKLDLYGHGEDAYLTNLIDSIKNDNLSQYISFKGSVPRDQIPEILASYDAMVFPSEWPEPFARTVLEGMATGLVVIGTTTGGTGEILQNEKTGLTFSAGDAAALAVQIKKLLDNPQWRADLAEAGQQCVVNDFSFDRMVTDFEQYFSKLIDSKTVEVIH
jgi:glycogen(starch) synthase